MDFDYKIYLERAENEIHLSLIIQKVSDDPKIQVDIFQLKEDTYYSASISHAYYSIFYAAKAYLLIHNIRTEAPEEHKKTFDAFSHLVEKGIIDIGLLNLYKNVLIRADTLLHIFSWEKGKRAKFTYKRIPQANQEPAEESIKNAHTFFRNISLLCEKSVKK